MTNVNELSGCHYGCERTGTCFLAPVVDALYDVSLGEELQAPDITVEAREDRAKSILELTRDLGSCGFIAAAQQELES